MPEFVNRANKKHLNCYDYSEVVLVNAIANSLGGYCK